MKNRGLIRKWYKGLLFLFMGLSFIYGIPRYALMNGESCILCHVDPTGTGLRNDYGILIVSQEELAAKQGKYFSDYAGMIGEHLRVGGDVRIQSVQIGGNKAPKDLAIFPMQTTIYAASEGKYHALLISSDFIQKDLRFQFQLKNLIPFIYLKGGKSRPSYGLQLDDHTSFIRGGNMKLKKGENQEGMPFTPFLESTGIAEVGIHIGETFIAVSRSGGYISGAGETMTGRAEQYFEFRDTRFMAGGSYLKESDLILKGIFGGISKGNWSWMGEVDLAENWYLGTSLASYSELAWRFLPGWTAQIKVDFFDADTAFKEDAIQRLTLGMSLVPFPFVDIKMQSRFSRGSGLDHVPAPEYLFQLHTWF